VIYEMRTYQVQPGKAGEFLQMYQASGLPIISRYARLIAPHASLPGAPGKRFPESSGFFAADLNVWSVHASQCF